MPCMKDYGKTWDYEHGIYDYETVLVAKDGKPELKLKRRKLVRYRKYANQYGVSGFKKI